MPAGAAGRPQAVLANGHRDFVVDDHEIVGSAPAVALQVRAKCGATEVHEGLRLYQLYLLAANEPLCGERLTIFAPRVAVPLPGEVVNQPPADIVPGVFVLVARIAKSNDDFHA